MSPDAERASIEALADEWNREPSCDHCGGSMSWVECESVFCDEGYTPPGQLYEEDPRWYDEDDVEPCDQCDAKGGWWECPDRTCSIERLNEKRVAHGLEPVEVPVAAGGEDGEQQS